jgi:IstB-like ATP binding protein
MNWDGLNLPILGVSRFNRNKSPLQVDVFPLQSQGLRSNSQTRIDTSQDDWPQVWCSFSEQLLFLFGCEEANLRQRLVKPLDRPDGILAFKLSPISAAVEENFQSGQFPISAHWVPFADPHLLVFLNQEWVNVAELCSGKRPPQSLETAGIKLDGARFLVGFRPLLDSMGRNGLGKTMIAQNICHTGVLAGPSVLLSSAAGLLDELHRQTPEGRRSKLRAYANVGLLCIDEVGYLSFDDKAADLLYEVVNRRYERKPLIVTTNRPFKE